jgi:hypothetical protein
MPIRRSQRISLTPTRLREDGNVGIRLTSCRGSAVSRVTVDEYNLVKSLGQSLEDVRKILGLVLGGDNDADACHRSQGISEALPGRVHFPIYIQRYECGQRPHGRFCYSGQESLLSKLMVTNL